MTTTIVLRPIHAWFGFWDAIAGPVSRIVAVVTGAAATAGLLVVLGGHPVVASVGALAAWIGLAIAQEHDGRVHLAPDPEFTHALAVGVAGPPLRLAVQAAHGPARARPNEPEVFVLGPGDSDEAHPFAGWYVEVIRDPRGRPMRLSAHPERGASDSVVQVSWPADSTERTSALTDADAIATALRSRLASSP